MNPNLRIATFLCTAGILYFSCLVGFGMPFLDSLLKACIPLLVVGLLTYILNLIQYNYHPKKPLNGINISIIACFTAIYIGLYWSCIQLLNRIGVGIQFPQSEIILHSGFIFLLLVLINLYWWIQKNERTQQYIQQQIMEKERLILHAELAAVHEQFQPHFLFNSLNSISALTLSEPKLANEMIHQLSDYLRGTLKQDMQQKIELQHELEQLNRYLAIEKVRFGHRLSILITHTDSALQATIPVYILQPIVENAIKYGIYGQLDELTISVDFSMENNQLVVCVVNPYDENYVASAKGKGVGLSTIQRRLALLYGRNDLLKTSQVIAHQNGNAIFQTELIIPQ